MPQHPDRKKFMGQGILKPRPGTNYILTSVRPNEIGQEPKFKSGKLSIPAGAQVDFSVKNAPIPDNQIVFEVRVYREQHTPHVHTKGMVVYKGQGEITVNIGPDGGEIEDPIIGRVRYIP